MKVLYVEDDTNDAYLAQRELAKNAPHILVDITSTLNDARFHLLKIATYDLVLCDLHLPDGDGLELLSEIREQDMPLAVVILTGQGDEKIAVAALKAGADDYLAKREGYLDRLPMVIENALARFRAESIRKSGKLRVLYAEHNAADIDLTRRHLEKHAPHIRLDVVYSAQSALQKLPKTTEEAYTCDVLLLDFHLPGENAMEVLKILHDERHLDIPVILVTGQGDEEVAAQALRLGAGDYLVKHPNYLYELPAALENAYYRVRLAREQAALRESEARYRLIVENSTFGIVVHIENQIVYVNKTGSNLIGARYPEELYGRHIIEFIHPEERPMIMQLIQQAFDPPQGVLSSEPLIVEERLIRLDGSIINVEASAIPIDYYGKTGLLVMMNEITQRKRAEKLIQESEAKFRSYIEHAPLAFFVANKLGYYVEFNKAAEELLGYDEDTLQSMTVLDVTADEDREAVLRDFSAVLDGGYVEGEYRLKKHAGELVWVNVRAVKLNDDRAIAFCQDITERKAAEQALRDQVRLQDQLAKITASVPGMIASLRQRPDGSTCMPYSSPALADLYGLEPEDVFEDASPALSLIHPDDMLHVAKAMEESARNLTPFRDEWRVRHPRRGEIWVEGHTMPLREPDGGTLWHGFIQDITERKQAEAQLRYQAALLAVVKDAVIATNGQLTVTSWNPAAEAIYGWKAAEIIGRSLPEILQTQYEGINMEAAQQTAMGTGDFHGEVRQLHKDGHWILIESNVRLTRNREGNVTGLVGVNRDITERKRAEESLHKSEERYRSLFENMLGGYAYCQMLFENDQPEDFIYLEVNNEFEPLTGLKDVVGKKVTEVIPGIKTTNPGLFEIYGRVAISGQPERFEDYFEQLKVWLSISVYSTEKGTFVAVFENITERKRAEEALKESEQRLALHVQKTPLAVIEWDNHFQVVQWNPAAEKIFGYTANEALGKHSNFIAPGITRVQVDQVWKELITQQGGERSTNENVTQDGQTILCEWYNTPLVTSDGKIIGVASMVQDITDRKRAEVALRTSESQLSNAMKIAHLGHWEYDVAKDLFTFNDYFYALLRTTAKQVGGYTMSSAEYSRRFVHPDEISMVGMEIQKAIETTDANFTEQMEHRIIYSDGQIGHVVVRIFIVKDNLGRTVRTYGVNQDITERKQAEVALKASEENYRSLIENSESAIAILDRDGQILYSNPMGIRIWNDPEIVGKTIFNVYPKEHARRYSMAIKRIIDKQIGIVEDIESLINNRPMWFRISMSPLRNPEGTVNRLVLNAWDITERKQAEEELQFRNVLLSTQQETSIDAILVVDEKTRILSYNRRFIEMMGIPEKLIEARVDEPILQYMTTCVADPQTFLQRVQYLYEHRQETSQDELVLVDGRVLDRYSAPMFGADQRYFGRIWYFRDITERKRAEAELLNHRDHLEELVKERTAKLAESEASLRKYFEEISDLYHNAPCGYQSVDQDGIFLRMNDTELNWLGYTQDEIIGKKKLGDILAPDSQVRFLKEFPAFKERGSLQNVEVELIRKNGTMLPVLINATALFDGNGSFIMSRETLLDNTERIRADKALREGKEAAESANRAKSTFLANMSHEIRTPMNAILGFTQLMLREPGLNPSQEQRLNIINRSGEHLLELINDILETSKIEADRITINPTPIDLHALIHDLEMMFKGRTDEKNLQFMIELSPNLPQFVIADGSKLRQIFINLLGNAVKFTDQGSIIWRIQSVRKSSDQLYLQSEVEDTGPGIAPEELGLLFQVFGQTSTGLKVGGGTGLGLAISSKYAQMMGGTLSVISSEGKGSNFLLEVEIRGGKGDDGKPELPLHQLVRLKSGQSQYRVLVVDDQIENRLLATEMLTKAGFISQEAANGKEAVELTLDWEPHIILMDLRMPVMDGYEAIRRIKATQKGSLIPIIAVTASAFINDEKEVLQVGANAYIRKPFKEQALFRAIEDCLGMIKFEHEDETSKHHPKTEPLILALDELPIDFPEELIVPLQQATLTANMGRLLALIDQVGQHSPQIAAWLRQLANQYQYDVLLALFQKGKKS
jgi:two-component system sensor histidine kinase/response regulator